MLKVLKRIILWDYHRGVWQYDVMCGLIVIFIAFAPPRWFRDQPRPQFANQLSDGVYWIEPELVNLSQPEAQQLQDLGKALKLRTGKDQQVVRIEKIVDAENETKGYMAYTRR